MDDELQGVVRQVYNRYPLLHSLAARVDGSSDISGGYDRVPPFLGVLLSTIDEREVGASCIVLPSRDRIPFAVALLAALTALKRSFDELELDRLTTPLRTGSLVRVAPIDRVFEVVEDGKEFQGQRWILLKNPADDQIHYMSEGEAFRLTPTDEPTPRPHKGMRPGRWRAAPIDRLLGIRTGGNLAVVPNRVLLVAPRGKTKDLASSTVLFALPSGKTRASELVSWGRVTTDGRVVSEDGSREPMVAVTHSLDYMAAACRRADTTRKLVIVDGARSLAANLQAYDDAIGRHRLLILSDHAELDHVGVLADRECDVWAPRPTTVLMAAGDVSMKGGWFSVARAAARNCQDLCITPVQATDSAVERLHETIEELRPDGAGHEEAQRLVGKAWLLLITVSGWLDRPGAAALEFFDRQIADLEAGLRGSRIWLSRALAEGLEQVLAAADGIRRLTDVGRSKREALLALLRTDHDAAVVTRSAPGAARLRVLLERTGFDVPSFTIAAVPNECPGRLIACSWPGRSAVSRLVSRYVSPRIDVLTYPFENPWLSTFADRWSRQWTRYTRSAKEVARLTGLSNWPVIPPQVLDVPPRPAPEHDEDDPITWILSHRRKGRDPAGVPEKDAREARYVGFHGSAYCFLTEGHKVPVLTDLLLGGQLPGDRVPLRPVRKLIAGDFVLFRDHGDQDVISTIAALEMGSSTYKELRRIADLWRPALSSIADDPYTIWRKLRSSGLERSTVTVRLWLTDGDRIGPGTEKDLQVIADVSGDEELAEHLDRVSAAIRAVRAAHIRAGFTLSKLLLQELPGKLPELDEGGRRVEFTFGGGWVLCIDEIGELAEDRPYWEVNQLLFEEEE